MIDHDAADARELSKLARYVRRAQTDTDAVDAINATCGAKGVWEWRSTEGDRAECGNTSSVGVNLANTFTMRDPNAAIAWASPKFEVKNAQTVLHSTPIYSGNPAPPVGGPYTALSAWPNHRRFMGAIDRSVNISQTITRLLFNIGTIELSATVPGNWTKVGDPNVVTLPNKKPINVAWDFLMEMQTRLDGIHSPTLYRLMTGQHTQADARHFGIATGGAEMTIFHEGTSLTDAIRQHTIPAVAIGNNPGSTLVTSEWKLYGPDLTGLKLTGTGENFKFLPKFGASPNQESFFNRDGRFRIKIANNTNVTLDLTTSFGGLGGVNLVTQGDLYLTPDQTTGQADVEAQDGRVPYNYYVSSRGDLPSGLTVTIGSTTGTVVVRRESAVADGSYTITLGVTDADSNTATSDMLVLVGTQV